MRTELVIRESYGCNFSKSNASKAAFIHKKVKQKESSYWDDFTGPLLFLSSPDKFTMALGLRDFQGQRTMIWKQLMAASVVFNIPIVVAFFFAQRTFIQGIKLTGSKE